jgi:hypothetical protein
MRRLALVFLLACGGKIESGADASTIDGADDTDPLGGGGHQLAGVCHFRSSFKPNGGDWIFQTDTAAVSTAKRPSAKSFSMLCAGKGNESFYYQLTIDAITLDIGSFGTMGKLVQVSNGREAEVTEWGACTAKVGAISQNEKHDVVDGAFDCPDLRTLTGAFSMKGEFQVPLP